MNTETGFDIDWEKQKIVEVTSPLLTRSQLIVIEDEAEQFLRMNPETLESQAFQFITGLPAPR